MRSQGHIHVASPRNGWSTPELYEIWQGRACILMQETATDDPGRCFAITAGPGEVVIVPPGWAHATISADPREPLVFGAWSDRAYGFVYDGVRAHGGLAHFPLLTPADDLAWTPNPRYQARPLVTEKIYSGFRCIEAANIPETAVPLAPSCSQHLGARLSQRSGGDQNIR